MWLVEVEGRQRPLDEHEGLELVPAIRRLRRHVEQSVKCLSDEDQNLLKVICRFDPEKELRFSFKGPADVVNTAIDRIVSSSATSHRSPSGLATGSRYGFEAINGPRIGNPSPPWLAPLRKPGVSEQ
jgi:hypothetical protein